MPYIGKSPSFGVRNRFVYVASSGDTSVSGADANGATLTFTDGAFVDVYLNGVLLKPTTDYNTSTANTIAGLSALNTSDEVTVVVYDVFAVSDTVSATSGGTFSGNVTFNGDISVGDDVSLASDGAVLSFGADSEITLTHRHNDGLILKHTGTGSGSRPALAFHAGETDIAANDVLGKIEFQAPDEATGTDAILIAAEIRAISEGDFSASSNATSLEFRTGASESATTKMTLTSAGELSISSQPSISADGNSTSQLTFDSADRTMTEFTTSGNSEFYSQGITFDSSNGRFTVPVAGKYLINSSIYTYSNSVFQRLQVAVNGSVRVHYSFDNTTGDGDLGQDNSLTGSTILNLAASDYVQFIMYHGSGTKKVLANSAHTHVSLHKLS